MTWVKIDDAMPNNPKVKGCGLPARWAYIASICYSGRYKTNGKIPRGALADVQGTAKIATELVSAGLWEAVSDGWLIHDFLKYNRSKEQAERISESASQAGKASAEVRYGQQNAGQNVERNVERTVPQNQRSVERDVGKTERTVERNVNEAFLSASASAKRLIYSNEDLPEAEEDKNEPLNDPFTEGHYREICDFWLHATGMLLTPAPAELMVAAAERTSLSWMKDAIAEMAQQGVRNPKYALAIIERWEREGREPNGRRTGNQPVGTRGRDPQTGTSDPFLDDLRRKGLDIAAG